LLLVEVWRWGQLIVGWLLLILGPLIGGPLPGPFGVVGFAAGLILVLRNSRWARRFFIRLKRRHPGTVGPVRHALKHGINLPSVLEHMWSTVWSKLRRQPRSRADKASAKGAPTAPAPLEGGDG